MMVAAWSIRNSATIICRRSRIFRAPRCFSRIPRISLGPMGAKSMSESPYNPVAAALGNALADATGIRFTAVPFKPDRLWPLLHEKFG